MGSFEKVNRKVWNKYRILKPQISWKMHH